LSNKSGVIGLIILHKNIQRLDVHYSRHEEADSPASMVSEDCKLNARDIEAGSVISTATEIW